MPKCIKYLKSSVKLNNIKVTHVTREPGNSEWRQPSWLGQQILRTGLGYGACTEDP